MKRPMQVVLLLCGWVVSAGVAAGQPVDPAERERFEAAKRRLAEKQRAVDEANARAAMLATRPATAPAAAPAKPVTPAPAAAAPATPAPAAPPARAAPGGRPAKAILADLDADAKLLYVQYPLEVSVQARYRNQFLRLHAQPLRRQLELLDELALADPTAAADFRGLRIKTLARLSLYGDAAATQAIDALAAGPNPADALVGRLAASTRDWWAKPDADAQLAALESIRAVAAANPRDDVLPDVLLTIARVGAASIEVANRARDVVEQELTGAAATKYKARPDKLGRPLAVAGTTLEGKAFSTADWKGKVVMVDFWASWCPPCRAAMPEVAKFYAEHRDRGLEILGVSCDSARPELQKYLSANPQVTWPQLFGPSGPRGWHALAQRYQLGSVPTIYLIDRNGVLRETVVGRFPKDAILALLNEPARPEPPPATAGAAAAPAVADTAGTTRPVAATRPAAATPPARAAVPQARGR